MEFLEEKKDIFGTLIAGGWIPLKNIMWKWQVIALMALLPTGKFYLYNCITASSKLLYAIYTQQKSSGYF